MRGAAYSSTFVFETGELDADFDALDGAIARQARAIPGFLGEESWHDERTGLHSEIYYWASLGALQQLVEMTEHLEAKRQSRRWLGRYRVVIAEVRATYGDPDLGVGCPDQR